MITKRKMEEAVFPADGLKTKSEVDAIAQWKSARLRTARGLRRCLAGMLLCPRPQRKHEKSENNRREDQGNKALFIIPVMQSEELKMGIQDISIETSVWFTF